MELTFWIVKVIFLALAVSLVAVPTIFFKREKWAKKSLEFGICVALFIDAVLIGVFAGMLGRDIIWSALVILCTGYLLVHNTFKLAVLYKTLGMDIINENAKKEKNEK